MSKKLSTDIRKAPEFDAERDVLKNYVLYKADYLSSLRKIQAMSFGSFALWIYMALFVRDYITDEPIEFEKKKIEETGRNKDSKLYSTWDNYTHIPNKYKWSLVIFCLVLAYGSLFLTGIYVSKCIQSLTLMKGGKQVLVKTPSSLSFLPKLIERTIPVSHFSCMVTREQAKAYMPIKVKGIRFFLLLKTNGQFPNPLLFDKTVGRSRKTQ